MPTEKELMFAYEHATVVLKSTGKTYLRAKENWQKAREAWLTSLKEKGERN